MNFLQILQLRMYSQRFYIRRISHRSAVITLCNPAADQYEIAAQKQNPSVSLSLSLDSSVVSPGVPKNITPLRKNNTTLVMGLCGGGKTVTRKLVLLYARKHLWGRAKLRGILPQR
ncbi:MAG: hypothetical protein L6R40_000958 [Gallowayella cf. fulva]|nr:MAG: hypothetical protein L6R40_000958 [Xanthomendoza cf. fulva]